MRRIYALLIALVWSLASAQYLSTTLPITSLGGDLRWTTGDEKIQVEVLESGQLLVDGYSPYFNPDDYRSATYFGDERYDPKQAIETTFELKDERGNIVFSKAFGSGKHDWINLFTGNVQAGKYNLRVATKGWGKNTFFIRTKGVKANILTQGLSLNFRGEQWIPVMNLDFDNPMKPNLVLRMYDGDGIKEMDAQLIDPNGTVRALKVSDDLVWADTVLPQISGRYTVLVRQIASAKQYSNTIRMELFDGNKPEPFILARNVVDKEQKGRLEVQSVLILPGGTEAIDTSVLANSTNYTVPRGGLSVEVPSGKYQLTPATKLGATISAPNSVDVPLNGVGKALIQYRPDANITLVADRDVVAEGEIVTFTATGFTQYANFIPSELYLQLPDTFEPIDPLETSRPIRSGTNVVLVVKAKATRVGTYITTAKLEPWKKNAAVNVRVIKPVTLNLEKTVEPREALVGQMVQFNIKVTNTGDMAAKQVRLTDTLPQGLQGDSLDASFDLNTGESKTFKIAARVLATASNSIINVADLRYAAANVNLNAKAVLAIIRPVLEREPLMTPSIPGEEQDITIRVRNPGSIALPFVLVDDSTDLLEAQDAVRWEGTLSAGETKTFVYRAKTVFGFPDDKVLTATLTSNNDRLTATTPFARVLFTLQKTVKPEMTIISSPVTYNIRIVNPLDRVVKARLSGVHDGGLNIEGENALLSFAPRETKDLELPATVEGLGVLKNTVQLFQGQSLIANPANAQVEVLAALSVRRESTVCVPFTQVSNATKLVVSQKLLDGAKYVPGSSRLDEQEIADPKMGKDGTLYWVVNGLKAGTVNYRVVHNTELSDTPMAGLMAVYANGKAEVLANPFDLQDYQTAVQTQAGESTKENAGIIKLPLQNAVIRGRESASIVMEGPIEQEMALTVNGEPVSNALMGKRVIDEGKNLKRFEYFGVALQVGENVIRAGDDEVRVTRPGAVQGIRVTALQPYADGSTPIRLLLETIDKVGISNGEGFIDVMSNVEPNLPDANPMEGGYQVRLVDGAAVLELRPQVTPTPMALRLRFNGLEQSADVRVLPSQQRVFVGQVSIGALMFPFQWSALGRAYYEGPLWDGKLYVAVASDGLKKEAGANELYAFPLRGNSSVTEQPLFGIDPLAIKFENSAVDVSYRQGAVPVDILPVAANMTALSVSTKGASKLGAYAAYMPTSTLKEVLLPDGTRLRKLGRGGIQPNSESVALVIKTTTDSPDGTFTTKTETKNLRNGIDYVVDYEYGILELSSPLMTYDNDFAKQHLEVTYRLVDANLNRKLTWGVQYTQSFQSLKAIVGAVNNDGMTTVAGKLNYRSGPLEANVGVSSDLSGYRAQGDVSFRQETLSASVKASTQTEGYQGADKGSDGTSAQANIQLKITDNISVNSVANYTNSVTKATDGTSTNTVTGSVEGGIKYDARPFSVGLGVRQNFGGNSGLQGVVNVGFDAQPFGFQVEHAQSFGGSLINKTNLSAKYAIQRGVLLTFKDEYLWDGNHRAIVGLENNFGSTNLSVGYILPNISSDSNRVRFGADTVLGLSEALSLNLKGSYERSIANDSNDLGSGVSLKFKNDGISANVGVDFASNTGATKTVLRSGISGSLNSNLALSGDYTREFTASGGGTRATFGFAATYDRFTALGFLRYADGSLANNNPVLLARLAATYFLPNLQLRAGADMRYILSDQDSLTYQVSGGGTYYVTEWLGLGANGRFMAQPGTNTSQASYGVEASLRVLQGFWLTGGYNFAGFDGIESVDAQKGFYVRADILADDTLFGRP